MELNFKLTGTPREAARLFREEGPRTLAVMWLESRLKETQGQVELGELSDIAFACDFRLEVKFDPNKKAPLSTRGPDEKTQNGPG